MNPRRIEVRIGELRVEGFAPAEARRLAGALERAIARSLTFAPAAGAHARVDAAPVHANVGISAERLGDLVGRAVARSLRR